jgi:Arc/MetJ-type ribon-helix-helix transcriptional regulator
LHIAGDELSESVEPTAWFVQIPGQDAKPSAKISSWISMESKAMNINLTPEQEEIVKDQLKTGHFRTVEEVIAEALHALREKERSSSAGTPNGKQREAVREMLAFVEKNRTRLDGISIKDLIHEGHRL